MSFEPDSLQRLVLWRLALSDDGGEFVKNIETTTLGPPKRTPLVREGLVVEEKIKIGGKGRALPHLELTDKGWAWCQAHLGESLKFRGTTPKLAGVVLERLLGRLQNYFETQSHTTTFGEFMLQSRAGATTHDGASAADDSTVNGAESPNGIAAQIRDACRTLANGRENSRVRLADLRNQIRVDRRQLDEALLEMERAGELSLYELNNPREIADADRQAALQTAAGNMRHVVYFGGKAS